MREPAPPRGRAASAGCLAAAAGLAAAELAAGLLGLGVTPVLAVGQAVIALVPGAVVERAIAVLGQADKPLLVGGVVAAVIGLGALAGVLSRRRPLAGLLVVVAAGGVGIAAVLARPGAGPGDVVPSLAGVLVTALLLPVLVDAAGRGGRRAAAPRGRRAFLQVAGGVAVLSLAGAALGRLLGRRRRALEEARAGSDLRLTEVPTPAGADLGVDGVDPWRTPVDDFYRIDTALTPPLVHPDEWRLRIHGLVDKELVLGFDDLVSRGLTDAWVTLCCVSNEVGGDLVGNAVWSGVPLSGLLREAGVRPGADAVLSTSVDGWTCSTPLQALTDGRDALLAVAMDGEPLPVEHGFPVRMVVPGLYGFVSATKWVVDLEVTRFADITAYWTARGWAEQAPVKTASRIDVPRHGAALAAGRITVAGVAWAQHRGIQAVEVRVDDGPWRPARLGAVPSEDTWRQWAWEWQATAGRHRLAVRATDGDGQTQTGERAKPVPDGATGWHTIEVEVRG